MNCTKTKEIWRSHQCVIGEEIDFDIDIVKSTLKINDSINKIIKRSKRRWFLDQTLIFAEAKSYFIFWREEAFYYWLDFKDWIKDLFK